MKTLTELAQISGVTEATLDNLAKNALPAHFEHEAFRGRNDELSEENIRHLVATAFIRLANRFPDKFPDKFPMVRIAKANRLRYIGIFIEHTLNKSYVVPSVNGDSYVHMKCEFTSILHEDLEIRTPTFNKEAQVIRSAICKAKTSKEAVAALLNTGVLFVGSVGCRSTNKGTDVHVTFKDVPTPLAQETLEKFVDIKNEQNVGREYGFTLTYLSEVAQLFDAIGLKDKLQELVSKIKKFEEENDLRKIRDENGGFIPDYKSNSMKIQVPLTELAVDNPS